MEALWIRHLVAELVWHVLARLLLELLSDEVGALLLVLVVLVILIESELVFDGIDSLVTVVLLLAIQQSVDLPGEGDHVDTHPVADCPLVVELDLLPESISLPLLRRPSILKVV
jgi:hypothetical protein